MQGVDVVSNKTCIIKRLNPIKKKKIQREVLILKVSERNDCTSCVHCLYPTNSLNIFEHTHKQSKQNLAHGPNIIKLLDVVRDPESKTPSLVFEYVNNTVSVAKCQRYAAS